MTRRRDEHGNISDVASSSDEFFKEVMRRRHRCQRMEAAVWSSQLPRQTVLPLKNNRDSSYSYLDTVAPECLVTDRDCGRILLIGLFRSNEVKDHHILATTLRGLRTKTTEYNFGLQEIAVENLKPLISHVLSSTDQQISALAALCYKRTHGNVFFLLQFLTSLHDRTLLEFNFGTLKWTWDVDEIEQRTAASDNVVDLLRTKMESLSEENRELLQTAACFGERFNQDILFLVWKPLYKTEQSRANKQNLRND